MLMKFIISPRRTSGEFGPISAKQAGTHLRMNAVGADDERELPHVAIREAHLGVVHCLVDRDALLAERTRICLQTLDRLCQYAEQVATVQHEVRRAKPLGRRRAELEPVPSLAGTPMADFPPRWHDLDTG